MPKGKIVLVPFPFDDLSASKVRPAICLTNSIGPHNHIVIAFITSQIPRDIEPSDVALNSDHPEFASMGLRVSSTLRLHRLMTISTSLILRELGDLPSDIHTEVSNKIKILFELE